MSLSKVTLLAIGFALGWSTLGPSTHANAQGAQNPTANMQNDIGEDEAIYFNAKTGKMTKAKTKMTAMHHTKAMAGGARELSKGVMIFKKGGKLYLLENKAGTAAGKTMIQEGFQDIFDGNHQY
jgi:hypothetical protein